MGQHGKEVDAESLQDIGRRRRGCWLDVCIITSILVLFAALTCVAAGGLMIVRDLRSELKPSPKNFDVKALKLQDAPPQTYKMQNFAYLEAISSELKFNSTMHLGLVRYGEGTSVGHNFIFDPEEHSLTPMSEGTYFMYMDLHLTCTHQCSAGFLSVQVVNKLTCDVELPSNSRSVKRQCWSVTRLEKDKLLTQITVPKGGLPDWELKLGTSGLGMFLVD